VTRCLCKPTTLSLFLTILFSFGLFSIPDRSFAAVATTTIVISICNDGILNPGEICDNGPDNDGAYGSSSVARRCNTNCSAYGPYCGDNILQALYSEQCDDGNNVSGDLCSATCTQEAAPLSTSTPPAPPPTPPPTPSGGSGGGGVFNGFVPVHAQTRVILEGKAYPNASINILKDGAIVDVVPADTSANFSYNTSNVTPGPTTFGFWATDGRGIRSITFTTTFQVTQNAVTSVSNVFLPPTIDLKQKKVTMGEILDALGSTAPLAKVSLFVDKEKNPRMTATSSTAGLWNAAVPTLGLPDEAFHAIKGMFEQIGAGAQAKSGFSQAVNFYVGTRDVQTPGSADLNSDGKVNLVDFSILLFHWGTDHAIADLNSDGKVNLTDFSILLFNWTG
jgi:cysteine-rich repeat protein